MSSTEFSPLAASTPALYRKLAAGLPSLVQKQ